MNDYNTVMNIWIYSSDKEEAVMLTKQIRLPYVPFIGQGMRFADKITSYVYYVTDIVWDVDRELFILESDNSNQLPDVSLEIKAEYIKDDGFTESTRKVFMT